MIKVFTHDCRLLNSKLFFFLDFLEIDVHQSHSAALFSTDAIEHTQKT